MKFPIFVVPESLGFMGSLDLQLWTRIGAMNHVGLSVQTHGSAQRFGGHGVPANFPALSLETKVLINERLDTSDECRRAKMRGVKISDLDRVARLLRS